MYSTTIHKHFLFYQIFYFLYNKYIVLSQLQQELSYRFLHANSQVNHSNHQQHQHQHHQHGFKHPQQPIRRDSGQAMDTTTSSGVAPTPPPAAIAAAVGGGSGRQGHQQHRPPQGFKWCYAHVHIAQQIQQQQQRAKVSTFSTIMSCTSSS